MQDAPLGATPPIAKGSAQVVFTTHSSLPLTLPINRAAPRGALGLLVPRISHIPPVLCIVAAQASSAWGWSGVLLRKPRIHFPE